LEINPGICSSVISCNGEHRGGMTGDVAVGKDVVGLGGAVGRGAAVNVGRLAVLCGCTGVGEVVGIRVDSLAQAESSRAAVHRLRINKFMVG
jgi:hypothetical protein